MKHRWYILDGKKPVPCDLDTWARWFGVNSRHVDQTQISDQCAVSTVFLGLDHQHGDGPPHIFETLVFGGPFDQQMIRTSTWDEAQRAHDALVRRIRGANEDGISNG